MEVTGIRVVGKGQLERTRSWKVLSWKVWSWKEPSKVGKNLAKLERTHRSWKASFEVEKFCCSWKVWINLEICDWSWKVTLQIRVRVTSVTTFQYHSNFPTSARTSQLQKKLSNFDRFFPTSVGSFQLHLGISNFSETFKLQTFQVKTFQLNVFQATLTLLWN